MHAPLPIRPNIPNINATNNHKSSLIIKEYLQIFILL